MESKKYKRNSSNTTVSIFCEQDSANKYNYEPPYQRDYNVWTEDQKSLLIDTIMKNFPMPPIFLQQIIENGRTRYDVIDGKQRLTTIRDFVNNKVPLPDDFGDDEYGISEMNGLYFSDIEEKALKNADIKDFLDVFWSYTISIEYIERTDEKNIVVDEIFDRLNRGGERLNSMELRKASHYDSMLYQKIAEVTKNEEVSVALHNLSDKRMEKTAFVLEIFLMALEEGNVSGESDKVDKLFEKYVDAVEEERLDRIANNVLFAFRYFNHFKLDLVKYSIGGTSHLYALLYLAYSMYFNGVEVSENFIYRLNAFYDDLRGERSDANCERYSESMQAQTKSKSARKKRVNALCDYMHVKPIDAKK